MLSLALLFVFVRRDRSDDRRALAASISTAREMWRNPDGYRRPIFNPTAAPAISCASLARVSLVPFAIIDRPAVLRTIYRRIYEKC